MKIQLKNGKRVTIREAQTSDAYQLLEAIKTYIPQSEFIPKLEREITLTLEQEEDWIDSFIRSDNSLLLVAEFEGRIIGNIDLTGSRRQVMQHTAVIGMGMIESWRGIGLGTALMEQIIDWAKENPLLELIWLQAYTANSSAIQLYKKMGFVENGILPQFFKNGDVYYDNLTMSLKVG